MIKAVLFDMDGTVFDTERIYRECWFRAAEAVGFFEMEDLLARIFGVSEREIGDYVYKKYGADFPYEQMLALRAEMIAQYVEEHSGPLKDGVPEVFSELHRRGVACALVSSAPAFRIRDFLSRSRLEQAFDHTVSGDRVKNGKPSPDIFLLAAQEMGLSPAECMVAEDSHNGVLAGHRAGMSVAMIPDLQPFAESIRPYVTHLLASLAELPALLDR